MTSNRTDIWAFVCVLDEMLTGPAAFSGAGVDNRTALVVNRNDATSHVVLFDRFWDVDPD
jgi:hypothetical protein